MSRARAGRWLSVALGTGAALAAQAAPPALWGFVDGHGVAHVAQRPLDGRYQLLLGDARRQALPDARVPGKTDGVAPLLTWMDFAPEAKVVGPWLREAEGSPE